MKRAGVMAGLLGVVTAGSGPPNAGAAQAPDAVYALISPKGGEIVRVLTTSGACPVLMVDGAPRDMTQRAAPITLPLRTTASSPELSKPSVFPDRVCEAELARNIRRATVESRSIPVLAREIRRIVVIGDTGCRLKAAEKAYQACTDPARYPFATIAAAAARFRPDLVIHVGDYLYRENPCPDDLADCRGPWGYGEDAWKADLLSPAAPLLAAAPWVFVRGNHETCVRAGQGWARFLSPWPLGPQSDCADPAHDLEGDFTTPYALDLDRETRLITYDSADTANAPLDPADPRARAYAATFVAIEALASGVSHVFLTNHHPVLAFFAGKPTTPGGPALLAPGNLGLQSVFARIDPRLFPANVDLLLSGHVHVEEQLSFRDDRFPSQLVTGLSGTQEDINPMPATLPTEEPAPGAVVDAFSAWVKGFGFATMEREAPGRWRILIHDPNGQVVNTCTLQGRQSRCASSQPTAEYGGP